MLAAEVAVRRAALDSAPERIQDVDWVQAKLAQMFDVDQLLRRSYHELPQALGFSEAERDAFRLALGRELIGPNDERNTADLKRLLAHNGWPVRSRFGDAADLAAFLIAQHSDRDRPFQREVLAMVERLVPAGETNPQNYALLFDRVAAADGRPQRYGTQGQCVGPGNWDPLPLENPDAVDTLRASVGLGSFAEYELFLNGLCD
jgi:hypothetical protein